MTTKYLCRECGNKYFTPDCPNGCSMFGFKKIESDTDYTPVTDLLNEAMQSCVDFMKLNREKAKDMGKISTKIYKAKEMLCQTSKCG